VDKITWLLANIKDNVIPVASCVVPATEIRANCVRFLGQLASNPANRELLAARPAVLSCLGEVARSGCVERACASAAIALANLVVLKNIDDVFPSGTMKPIIEILIQALARAVEGKDFPEGSNVFYDDWKLINGISKLVVVPGPREQLAELGLARLIQKAMERPKPNQKLYANALLCLWSLAETDFPLQASP